jgi:hypothetical protein
VSRADRFAERAAPVLPGLESDVANPARVRAGRAGLAKGIGFEQDLERHHQRAAVAGLATLWWTGRPTIGLRDDGSPIYGIAGPDFLGLLLDGSARAVAVEAKSDAGARLDRSAIAAHQAEALDATHRAGGLALVAVELRALGGRWAIPWGELAARWGGPRGGASVGPAELAGFELVEHPAGYLVRFVRRGGGR